MHNFINITASILPSLLSPECRKVKEHAGRIMAVLRLFIGHLHDPGQVTGQLERLGQWCGDQTEMELTFARCRRGALQAGD